MKVLVDGYTSFQNVVAEIGTPDHIIYSVIGMGGATSALALYDTGVYYIKGHSFDGITAGQFLTDFPGSILGLNVDAV